MMLLYELRIPSSEIDVQASPLHRYDRIRGQFGLPEVKAEAGREFTLLRFYGEAAPLPDSQVPQALSWLGAIEQALQESLLYRLHDELEELRWSPGLGAPVVGPGLISPSGSCKSIRDLVGRLGVDDSVIDRCESVLELLVEIRGERPDLVEELVGDSDELVRSLRTRAARSAGEPAVEHLLRARRLRPNDTELAGECLRAGLLYGAHASLMDPIAAQIALSTHRDRKASLALLQWLEARRSAEADKLAAEVLQRWPDATEARWLLARSARLRSDRQALVQQLHALSDLGEAKAMEGLLRLESHRKGGLWSSRVVVELLRGSGLEYTPQIWAKRIDLALHESEPRAVTVAVASYPGFLKTADRRTRLAIASAYHGIDQSYFGVRDQIERRLADHDEEASSLVPWLAELLERDHQYDGVLKLGERFPEHVDRETLIRALVRVRPIREVLGMVRTIEWTAGLATELIEPLTSAWLKQRELRDEVGGLLQLAAATAEGRIWIEREVQRISQYLPVDSAQLASVLRAGKAGS